MVDKEDDAKLGIHSATFLFGRYDVVAILCCYVAFFFLLWYCGHLLALNHWYNLGILTALLVSTRHYFLLRARQPALAFRVFLETSGLEDSFSWVCSWRALYELSKPAQFPALFASGK